MIYSGHDWLTITEYLGSRCFPVVTITICFVVHDCKSWIFNMSNTTGATCGAGTTFPSGAPEFSHGLVVFLL